MTLDDVQAVIDSARSRGTDSLDRFLRSRMREADADQIVTARDTCVDIIEAVPDLLARARREGEDRSLQHVVDPLLGHAMRYFVTPIDLMPEMTWGLAGLLDDAYLVLRILRDVDSGPEPLLDWEFDEPVHFLEGIMGADLTGRLDTLARNARRDADQQLVALWAEMGADA